VLSSRKRKRNSVSGLFVRNVVCQIKTNLEEELFILLWAIFVVKPKDDFPNLKDTKWIAWQLDFQLQKV